MKKQYEQSDLDFARKFCKNCGSEWSLWDLKTFVKRERGINLPIETIEKIMGVPLKRRKCEQPDQSISLPKSFFVVPPNMTSNDLKAMMQSRSRFCATQPKDHDPVEYAISIFKKKEEAMPPLLPYVSFESDPSQSPLPVPRIPNKMHSRRVV